MESSFIFVEAKLQVNETVAIQKNALRIQSPLGILFMHQVKMPGNLHLWHAALSVLLKNR
jgi:hypothetical protein